VATFRELPGMQAEFVDDDPDDAVRVIELDGRVAEIRAVKGKPGQFETTYVDPVTTTPEPVE
jgi:hypothetical protein